MPLDPSTDPRELLAEISIEERAQLERRLLERRARSWDRIPPRDPRAPVPLSFAQEHLWLVEKVTAGTAAFRLPAAWRLDGPLDVEALRRSLDTLIRRHAVLRTTFAIEDGRPVQRIVDAERAPFSTLDLGGVADDAAALIAALEADAWRPLDVEHDLPFRATLGRLSPREHVLLLVVHYCVIDAWSMAILVRELSALYEGFVSGRPRQLPAPGLEYADFAAWQRWLQSGDALAASLAYWRRQLSGAPQLLALPTDRPRPPVPGLLGARLPLRWPAGLASALEARGREEGATLYMTLLAALQVLVHRLTGEDDIVVGSPRFERGRVELEPVVGLFVNTLVLRTSLAGDPTFRALLRRVRETTLAAYRYADLPFERLVEELVPARERPRHRLVQVYFDLHRAPFEDVRLAGLSVRHLEITTGTSKADLLISLRRTVGGLDGYVEYDTDLFDAATVARTMDHLGTLLEEIAADPDRRVSALPLLSRAERRRAIVDWNAPAAAPPRASLGELFAAQVARAPDAAAVVAGDATLTYAELARRARRLARRLRGLGVGPDVRVALLFDRSPALVVGILGVVQAGGAYVPLDPTFPRARLGFVLADARVAVTLTVASRLTDLPPSDSAIVLLDTTGALADDVHAAPALAGLEPAPDSLAYVMYTSASTGTPKAVAVPHRAIAQLVLATNYIALGPGDVVAAASNPAFDAATFEIWGALLNGACLALFPSAAVTSPRELETALAEHAVTTLFLTPALFHRLARAEPSIFRGLATLMLGGEEPDPAAVARVGRYGRPARLLNMYGPTEATTFASWFEVDAGAAGEAPIPIGRPISNTELYVLDASLAPVPVGVRGEIHIGGQGLVRGYLDRPGQTAERFVPHPYASGSRLYRTGDLGCYRADGAIVFAGRRDDQVKIRGYRVEPAEVEGVLGRHPAVTQCHVGARDGAGGERALVAYLVAAPETRVTGAEVRRFVGDRLPTFMVPSDVVFLEALPLTSSGKIDRAALPTPDRSRGLGTMSPPPAGELERSVAAAWERVIGVEGVGRDADFFELGGQSLLAIEVASRLQRELGVDVPVRWLFEHPTLSALAARLGEAVRDRIHAPAPGVVDRPRAPASSAADRPHVPASSAQFDAWRRRRLGRRPAGLMVWSVFDVVGGLDLDALEGALDDLIARHEILRTGLCVEAGRLVQVVRPSYPVRMARIDLSHDSRGEASADRVLAREAARTFDYAGGPWVRATVVMLGPGRHRLMLGLPHSVYDAWSLDLFFRELEAFYAARIHGAPVELAPVPLQHADHVRSRSGRPPGGDDSRLAYWREKLRDLPDLPLPFRRRDPSRWLLRAATRLATLPGLGETAAGGWLLRAGDWLLCGLARRGGDGAGVRRCSVELAPPLVERVRALARAEGVTPFTVLLAAFKAVLVRETGRRDVPVFTFMANRDRTELAGTMGNMAGTLVLRTDLSGVPSFREMVRRVRTTLIEAQANGGVTIEAVSRALGRVGRLPLEYRVSVVFQLVERLSIAPRLPGLGVRRVRTVAPRPSLRLAVAVRDRGEALVVSAAFDPKLYDAVGCLAMLERYASLLATVVDDPDGAIGPPV